MALNRAFRVALLVIAIGHGAKKRKEVTRELHRLASAAGTLELKQLENRAPQTEATSKGASRIELFDVLHGLTRLCVQLRPRMT